MSQTAAGQPSEPAKATSKVEIISDVFVLLSILTAYLFLSLSASNNIFELIFELTFDKKQDIAAIFLVFAFSIFLLKAVVSAHRVIKKDRVEPESVFALLPEIIASSIFRVFFIVAFYLCTISYVELTSIQKLCHIAIWLLVAQLNLVLSGMLSRWKVMEAMGYFGYTIQVLILMSQVIGLFGLDFFDFL